MLHTAVVTSSCAVVTAYGAACPGSGGFQPAIDLLGCAATAGDVSFTLESGLGGSSALILAGLTPASIPLPGGCTLLVGSVIPANLWLPLAGSGAGAGTVTLPVGLPAIPTLLSFTLQAFVTDPGVGAGFAASQGLRVDVPP